MKKYIISWRHARQRYQASLDQAEVANEEAQTLLADYRTTLANAETEKRAIIKAAKAEADQRADVIVGDAKQQAQKIIAEAHEKMRQMKKRLWCSSKKRLLRLRF